MKLKQIKTQAQKGFTMIELVIVIAILGILAAFALPRFANFTQDAQTSAATSVAGTLNASLGIVKAKFVANGSTGTTVDLDGNSVTTNDIVAVTSTGDLNMATSALSLASCGALVDALLSSRNGLTVAMNITGTSCRINGSGYSVNLTSTGATVI
jgi:prepilin-type N-terminal cleavage/methylation domain-containing protein